jgi:hypothetical protein
MLTSGENRVAIALQHNAGTPWAWAKGYCHALIHSRPDREKRDRKIRDIKNSVTQDMHATASKNIPLFDDFDSQDFLVWRELFL